MENKMKTRFQQFVRQLLAASVVSLLTFVSLSAEAQVNMSRRIDIVMDTTTGYPSIMPKVVLAADSMHTPLKIVCGMWDTIVYVDSLTSRHIDSITLNNYYPVRDTANLFYTVSIYGDVSFFSCQRELSLVKKCDFTGNDALRIIMCDSNLSCDGILLGNQPHLEALTFGHTNIGGIDVSRCPSLKLVGCHVTDFSSRAYDELMCQLPQWQPTDSAKFFVSDALMDTSFSSSNSQIALAKNWIFYDRRSGATTVQTNGTYVCQPSVRRIRLKVQPGNNISLNFAADTSDSPIRVVSGTTDRNFTADTVFTMRSIQVPADDTVMDFYGAVKVFQCYGNRNNVTALDLSQNPYLKKVECTGNAISDVVFGGLNFLETLILGSNNLTSIDLSHSPYLTSFDCQFNNISTLDLSHNSLLRSLSCDHNNISSLDISNNPQLKHIICNNNRIATLDISTATDLTTVRCYANGMSSRTLDEIMCAMPTATDGIFAPIGDVSDSNDVFYDANIRNILEKGWTVYDSNNTQVLSTNGTYVCGQGIETPEHSHMTITPNPANGSVAVGGLEADTEIQIIDLQGRTVKRQRATAGTAVIDIRDLDNGVYFVKTDYSCDKLIVR